MTRAPLNPVFRDLVEDPCHPLVAEARAAGRRAIGYTCSFVPEPLLSVDGLFPQRLRAPSPCGTAMADTYLSSVTCPYPRNLLEQAMDGRSDHIDGWVFVSSCDHVRRLYDNLVYLVAPAHCSMLDLPHKRGASAVGWYTEELRRLATELSAAFDVDTGNDALFAAIQRHNDFLGLPRALGDLRKRRPSPISGADYHRVLVACSTAPKDSVRPLVAEALEMLEEVRDAPEPRARVMVLGSGIDDPGYLDVVESVGACVVADRFCFGSAPGLAPIAAGSDPIAALAEHSLRTTQCPRMMGAFGDRVSYVLEHVTDYAVDGVILQTMKFCDLWGVEAVPLTDALREAGIPVLRVERDYAPGGEGQLRTRAQAFLESMGR